MKTFFSLFFILIHKDMYFYVSLHIFMYQNPSKLRGLFSKNMAKTSKTTIAVQDQIIGVEREGEMDFISLTDMANGKESESRAADIIKNWLRNRYTIEFLGTWEQFHNPDFKVVEFDHFKTQAGLPSFVLSVSEWIEKTHAIGLRVKKGKYGGTYAHHDIAMEFGSAISATFKLYLIKEFQRLKKAESEQQNLTWSLHRTLAKVNYRLQTDAIKTNLLPHLALARDQQFLVYASEADMLNIAVFGITAQQWREQAPDAVAKGHNIRDYANLQQLTVLSNLESYNAILIHQNISKQDRLTALCQTAQRQLDTLNTMANFKLNT